ncbi:MAG: tail fiber domain-containing protein, partial [Candidatus Dormibacteria bacterium]
SGNVTAYSDERLKKDWAPLADAFIPRLAAVKMGSFTRTDTGGRYVGVSAQSLEELLPEAVVTSDNGLKSVAYGNAALAACVELARRVIALTVELAQLKADLKE